jgi:hypothetical protein
MKKIILIIAIILCLCGCEDDGKKKADPDERYMYIIEMISEHESFQETSNYFDIAVEMAKIENGYRYYITIDNPRIAMYDVELLAIEKNVDYRTNMAANVGIFEEKEYHMVPNQSNPDQGYVKGIVASGISKDPSTTLYIFVQFKNSDYSAVRSEYFKLDVSYGDE